MQMLNPQHDGKRYPKLTLSFFIVQQWDGVMPLSLRSCVCVTNLRSALQHAMIGAWGSDRDPRSEPFNPEHLTKLNAF